MGYYSDLATEESWREDLSYPSPEMQLGWRIEDLLERLKTITGEAYETSRLCNPGSRYSREELLHAPADSFHLESDLLAALAAAEEKRAVLKAEKNGARAESVPDEEREEDGQMILRESSADAGLSGAGKEPKHVA